MIIKEGHVDILITIRYIQGRHFQKLCLRACSVWTSSWMPGSAWRFAWSCTGLFSRRTDPKPLRLRPPTRRRNNQRNSNIFKCRPFICSAWTCWWICESAWISVWSCIGLFSRRTDPKPLRLRPPTRRRNNRQNSDILMSSFYFLCLNVLVKTWICVNICGSCCTKSPVSHRNLPRKRATFLNVVFSLLALFKYRPHPSQPDNKNAAFFKYTMSHFVFNMCFVVQNFFLPMSIL